MPRVVDVRAARLSFSALGMDEKLARSALARRSGGPLVARFQANTNAPRDDGAASSTRAPPNKCQTQPASKAWVTPPLYGTPWRYRSTVLSLRRRQCRSRALTPLHRRASAVALHRINDTRSPDASDERSGSAAVQPVGIDSCSSTALEGDASRRANTVATASQH